MNVLILISVLALFFTYLEYKGIVKNGMLIGFIILTAILGIRFEYGNDYISYAQKFYTYGHETFKFSDLTNGTISDPIWYMLNRLFYPLGFETMVICLTVIANLTYYKLIRLLPPNLWVFGLFIYLFTNSFMPMQLSMLRQALAMALIILATLAILNNKIITPSIFLVTASGIHSSAIICIPLILLLYLDFAKHKKIVIVSFLCLYTLFFVAHDFLFELLKSTLNYSMDSIDSLAKYDEKYLSGSKYEASAAKSWFGLILYLFPVAVNLFYVIKSKDEKMVKLSILYIFGAFVFLLDQIVPMVGRLAWYFTIFSIVSLPLAFKNINNKLFRIGLITLFIAITLKEYYSFFYSLNWRDSYMIFQTIFTA